MHLDAFGCIRMRLENFRNFGPKNMKNWNFGRDGLCERYWPVPGGHIYGRCVALSWGGSRLILNGKELEVETLEGLMVTQIAKVEDKLVDLIENQHLIFECRH